MSELRLRLACAAWPAVAGGAAAGGGGGGADQVERDGELHGSSVAAAAPAYADLWPHARPGRASAGGEVSLEQFTAVYNGLE